MLSLMPKFKPAFAVSLLRSKLSALRRAFTSTTDLSESRRDDTAVRRLSITWSKPSFAKKRARFGRMSARVSTGARRISSTLSIRGLRMSRRILSYSLKTSSLY